MTKFMRENGYQVLRVLKGAPKMFRALRSFRDAPKPWAQRARTPASPGSTCLRAQVESVDVHLLGEQPALIARAAVGACALEAVVLVELPGAVGVGVEEGAVGAKFGEVGRCGVHQHAANAHTACGAAHDEEGDLGRTGVAALGEQGVVLGLGQLDAMPVRGRCLGLELAHTAEVVLGDGEPALVRVRARGVGAGEHDATRFVIDKRDLGECGNGKRIGEVVARLEKAVFGRGALVVPSLLQDGGELFEVFFLEGPVRDARDHGTSCHIPTVCTTCPRVVCVARVKSPRTLRFSAQRPCFLGK